MIKEADIVGIIFVVAGLITILKRRVNLEYTNTYVTGRIALFIGCLFIGLGVYLFAI